MLSAWIVIGLYLSQELQRVCPILLTSSSESVDYFPWQFSVTLFVHVRLQFCEFRQVFINCFTFFSSINFIFRSTIYKLRPWNFYDETRFIFKICFELFLFTWYFIKESFFSTIASSRNDDVNDQGEINNFFK